MNARVRLLLVAALVLTPVLWLVTVTQRAESVRLLDSSPADAQLLAVAPGEIQLDLSAPADAPGSHLDVTDSAGRSVANGPVTAGPSDELRLPVRITGSGPYAVSYHVIGANGGETSGVIRFAVGGPAAAGPADPHSHEHGVDPLSAVLLLANFVAVIWVVVLLARRPAPVR